MNEEATAVYRCDDCGLHYRERALAEACYEHCTTHHACSIQITAHSVERTNRSPSEVSPSLDL